MDGIKDLELGVSKEVSTMKKQTNFPITKRDVSSGTVVTFIKEYTGYVVKEGDPDKGAMGNFKLGAFSDGFLSHTSDTWEDLVTITNSSLPFRSVTVFKNGRLTPYITTKNNYCIFEDEGATVLEGEVTDLADVYTTLADKARQQDYLGYSPFVFTGKPAWAYMEHNGEARKVRVIGVADSGKFMYVKGGGDEFNIKAIKHVERLYVKDDE